MFDKVDLTCQLGSNDDPVSVTDFCGDIFLYQHNEIAGHEDSVVLVEPMARQLYDLLHLRYGRDAKNTDRSAAQGMDDIDAILLSLA